MSAPGARAGRFSHDAVIRPHALAAARKQHRARAGQVEVINKLARPAGPLARTRYHGVINYQHKWQPPVNMQRKSTPGATDESFRR